ncbi:acetylpolyamine aminohydrolase [Achromobacter xylosoxidans]|uniref:histone deacetylase family protein n=1 Tax=Alcaligenes xylosoxydans xylosoxydans TaxID=85698 RepID=UPI0006BF7B91|nr:histone deacetylase family protein [Achromobacter xylosoxidans]OFL31664.1 acetylpolyamine aminohydrolase [Achromobacter xylosoxidans]OFS62636.1 acetylpolyamine aminohydrolase [Achromobacter xylosoxidans]CUI63596.1 Acetylpolyamine aminohydrolase [Achromobacter xylosoxidans]
MHIFHNPVHGRHDGRHEMFRGRLVPCHETPARLEYVLDALRLRGIGTLQTPAAPDLDLIRRVHSPRYVDFLQGAWADWVALDPANAELDILPSVWPVRGFRHDISPSNFAARVGLFSFDSGSPLTAGTWEAAVAGAACAIDAARAVSRGNGSRAAMALTRPPGHHAGADFFGGYCFLNNAALAAQALREAGAERVAVLDIDYHHGNGTQSIFYERGDVLTVSVHGDPTTEYPFFLGYADESGQGAGLGANLNLPLAAGADFADWNEALEQGLAAIGRFKPDALVIALGVDTYEGDPISKFKLRSADYLQVGARLARLGLPAVFTMEGGYAVAEVGTNVANVLEGYAG